MKLPEQMEPVLAQIKAIVDLGSQLWYEVVYYNGVKWCAYYGSDTFTNGEWVTCWIYAREAINNKLTINLADLAIANES